MRLRIEQLNPEQEQSRPGWRREVILS